MAPLCYKRSVEVASQSVFLLPCIIVNANQEQNGVGLVMRLPECSDLDDAIILREAAKCASSIILKLVTTVEYLVGLASIGKNRLCENITTK